MSQALYRQYRPQRFEDVVGQDVAVRTLRNAIEQDRVAHAYLFTGTKGTGKTTLAKILAKAMNCEQGPTTEPCGTCEECRAIADGRSMDVAEIDAASNTGIDHVREKIIDTVAFQPSRGTRRVYIIDEAHQLSKAAFNALLKTIEEPPPHVLFVFCTTETHMMMATVRDRCQRVAMRSPGPDTLLQVLQRVCKDEGINADDAALQAIARAAQGSFRNALGTLELLTTTLGSTFTRDDVLQHLGVVSEETLFDMADAIIDSVPAAVLNIVEALVQDGVDLDQFARALAEHLRMVMLAMYGVTESLVVSDAERLAGQAARADERRVLAAIDCIADAATRIRVGSDPRISIETALIRACQGLGLPLLALRLAALEQRETGSYGQPVAGKTPTPAPVKAAKTEAIVPNAAVAAVSEPSAASAAAAPTESFDAAALAAVDSWWPQVAQRVAATAAHRPILQQLTAESADTGKLVLRLGTRMPVSAKLRDALTDATRQVTGCSLAVEVVEPSSASVPAAAPASKPSPAVSAPISPPDEGMSNLMSMFDATPVESSDDADQ